MAFDKIFLNARFDGGTRHHIAVKDGRVTGVVLDHQLARQRSQPIRRQRTP